MNNRSKIAGGVAAVFIVIVVILIIGWKKWGWFSSSSPKSDDTGIPGDVTNVSVATYSDGKETGGRSYYTDEIENKAGLKINFTLPSQTGISGDNTFKGVIIELVEINTDQNNTDQNYIVKGNDEFEKDEDEENTYQYFDFSINDEFINLWKTDTRNTINSVCEIFIPIGNISTLENDSLYQVKIKAINNQLGVSVNSADSPDITYDACATGDELACGWTDQSNHGPPNQSIIELIDPAPVGVIAISSATFQSGGEVGRTCRPVGADANTLYRYDVNSNCVASGCVDSTFAFVTTGEGVTKCETQKNVGDSCGDGLIYHDITPSGDTTTRLVCDSASNPSDQRVLNQISPVVSSDNTCNENYKLNDENECVKQTCEEIREITTLNNGTFGDFPRCEITCNENYNLNGAGNGCVEKTCEDITGIQTLNNGTFGVFPGCEIICESGYYVLGMSSDTKCVRPYTLTFSLGTQPSNIILSGFTKGGSKLITSTTDTIKGNGLTFKLKDEYKIRFTIDSNLTITIKTLDSNDVTVNGWLDGTFNQMVHGWRMAENIKIQVGIETDATGTYLAVSNNTRSKPNQYKLLTRVKITLDED